MDLYFVLGTWALVIATIWVAWQQSRALRTDLEVRLQLRFSERFDSRAMASDRKRLAEQLLRSALLIDKIEFTIKPGLAAFSCPPGL